jgi:hypothetical protein
MASALFFKSRLLPKIVNVKAHFTFMFLLLQSFVCHLGFILWFLNYDTVWSGTRVSSFWRNIFLSYLLKLEYVSRKFRKISDRQYGVTFQNI